jgi:hypothetical protein
MVVSSETVDEAGDPTWHEQDCVSLQRDAELFLMSHPDPQVLPDRTAIQIGEVWENLSLGSAPRFLSFPPEPRAPPRSPNCSRVGGRVVGEHPHPTPVFGMDHLDHQAERLMDYANGTTRPAVEASGRSR